MRGIHNEVKILSVFDRVLLNERGWTRIPAASINKTKLCFGYLLNSHSDFIHNSDDFFDAIETRKSIEESENVD